MKRYRILFENAKNTLFIASATGKIIELNPAGEKLLGYTKAEAARIKVLDLYVDDSDRQRFWQEMERNGSVKAFEAPLRTKDNTIIDCLIASTAYHNGQGKIVGYQGSIRDISQRKKKERALQAYNQKLEKEVEERTAQLEKQVEQLAKLNLITQMVASGHDLQATLNIVAQEMVKLFRAGNCAITLLNEAQTELRVVADYSQNSAAHSTVDLVMLLADNSAATQVINTGQSIIIPEAQTNPLTESLHQVLQERNTHSLMILPLLSRGQVIGTIGVELDESNREFTAEELSMGGVVAIQMAVFIESVRLFDLDLQEAFEQLRELDRLKSAFIGVITHELRSPFVAAGLSVQLLPRYIEHQMFDELQRQIQQLGQELAEGRKMIDNVISFASLMSKKQDLNLQETDLPALIRETITSLEKMATPRHIKIKFKFDPHLPLVQVDRERISEAVYHLVLNGIKFNRTGGAVEISCFPDDKQVVVQVQDNGIGLPDDKLARIWDAFVQDSDDLRRGVEGLGLGLALVRFVVMAHNGEVSATSKLGHGSVFSFRLPVHPPPG